MQSIWLISQLLICLALGFLCAHRIPKFIEKASFKVLPYFSYILLFAIAFEFSQIIDTISSIFSCSGSVETRLLKSYSPRTLFFELDTRPSSLSSALLMLATD